MRDNIVIRQIVRSAYDMQKLRIGAGNRICAAFISKIPEDRREETDQILKIVKQSYNRITDGLVALPSVREFNKMSKEDSVIETVAELDLVHTYMKLLKDEEDAFKRLERDIQDYPIYTEFLKNVRGCGPAMAGVIISEIDISKAKYASSLSKFCGLDVVINAEGIGEGRSRKKHHLVDQYYVDAHGEPQVKKGLSFSPMLKTKLMGVLASCFLRNKSPYADIYTQYKFRLQNSPRHADKSDGHKHNMAMRYMIKIFLQDLYVAWRTLEGLPVAPPYSQAKLGLLHDSHRKEVA